MPLRLSLASELRTLYEGESARIQQQFGATGDGRAALLGRTALVESIVIRLWKELIAPEVEGPFHLALVALGGFGRRSLFPHSDIDLLYLHAGSNTETAFKDQIRRLSQEIWDLRMKLSPATRTLTECDRFEPDNLEFAISLLDCRYVCGDRELFRQLHDKVLPKLVMRESQLLVRRLAEVTGNRHAKFGDTVFHLEPNVKDGPGGLRDYNVACWLALISAVHNLRSWPDEKLLLPAAVRKPLDPAVDFLMSARCFLHFRHGRDDNSLTWEAQDDAAAQKIGVPPADTPNASDWMRIYFGHARLIHRLCTQLLEEIPTAWPSLSQQFQNWRSRLSNAHFSVVDGFVSLQQPASLQDPEMLLRTLHFVAQHGLKLGTATEYQIEQVLPSLAVIPPKGDLLWRYLQVILLEPYAADALRAMHSLRLLTLVLPELRGIDALVVRDYSHRFTVDEHSFLAIENLHRLRQSQSKWDRRYAEILDELEQPELLYLALLLHDTGKSVKTENHVEASVSIAADCLERLHLEPADRETVLFLIARHLEMSAALRRDIFDPETVRSFAERAETPERLKQLCLLTYADVKAVNPEALSPWKAENIWQLYIATANHLNRSVDERVHVGADDEDMTLFSALAPPARKKLKSFLEGLPRRYLRTHSPDEVLAHLEMAGQLGADPVQLDLKRGRHWYQLTLVTCDRPFLFATLAGALAAWGMNIVKAAAFSNQAATVVDTFYFTDRFRTLELNLPEWDRFQQSIRAVLTGKADLERMLRDRLRSEKKSAPKVKVRTQIEFDNNCSAHSTLIEVIAQDQPGLLHRISSRFAHQNCNIEIALIDTEGQMAIDVFYLTSAGAKLTPERQESLGQALLEELGSE
jgi:[protein-PII] uridylyltransferase